MGLAAGDALGAGYVFRAGPKGDAKMIGGGLGEWEPGEWTDDTQMAICIAEVAATGHLDPLKVGARFLDWYRQRPKDVGIQTATLLGACSNANELAAAAARHFKRHPRHSAGNGSLMRTAAVALAGLGDDKALARLAWDVSVITHADPLAAEACVLWCIAVDRAVREGRLDGVEDGLDFVDVERRQYWANRLEEARKRPPSDFVPNGFVVTAFQAALASVWHTPVPTEMPCRHLVDALQTAVKVGDDTDTVAAIAGSLLGARWGATAVPARWKAVLHGWPGFETPDLVRLAVLSAQQGAVDSAGWPGAEDMTEYYRQHWPAPALLVPLAEDPGVLLANVYGAGELEADVMVSLCRVGSKVPAAPERIEVGLLDSDDPADNPNLAFVLSDLAQAISGWRDEGKTVAVHCVQAERRTPAVAAAYLAQRTGVSGTQAWAQVAKQLPGARPNVAFDAALQALWPGA